MIFSIFQVSRDGERWLPASVRLSTLCGVLLERSLSWNNESFTAVRVRDHSAAMICFVQKCNWSCCNLFFNLIYLFVSRHEVHSMNTHTLQNAG